MRMYVPRWYCLSDKMTQNLGYTCNKKKYTIGLMSLVELSKM